MEGQKEPLACSVFAIKNGRRSMEDRHIIIPNLNSQYEIKSDKQYSYYAIFDGHAGPDAAEFAAENLHKYLINNSFFESGDIRTAFTSAYATTDLEFIYKSRNDKVKAGCTALTCLVENNKRLYMAWLGDSVGLLTRNGKPYFIMEPHSPDRSDERERIETMGGTVMLVDTWRVNGTLGVSRAIGDPDYKPYVCSNPDVEVIDLDGTEDFLILGCDGLWDRMTPEDAIELIYQHVADNAHKDPSEVVKDAARVLTERSIYDGSNDNITSIIIFLRDVSSILNKSSNSITPNEPSSNKLNCAVNGDSKSSINNGDPHDYAFSGNPNYFDNQVNNQPTGLNNNNNYDHPLLDNSDLDQGQIQSNGLIGNSTDNEDTAITKTSDEIDFASEEEVKNSNLNPFADEFRPNITSNNIIENQFGSEPKKDDDEVHKNESLEKKDSWMNEFKNEPGNDEKQEQVNQYYSSQSEMLDGLGDGLSVSENLSGSNEIQQQSTGLPSESFEENFLASDEAIVKQSQPQQQEEEKQNQLSTEIGLEPSAPEWISIEQSNHIEQQVIESQTSEITTSQAETFVDNLTPEVPSSPVVTNFSEKQQQFNMSTVKFSEGGDDYSHQYSFDTPQDTLGSNVNQYITSVSDAMSSEPYHDPYFASDSVEPESIIVNTCDGTASSGPHAIDPYSSNISTVNEEIDLEVTVEKATEVPFTPTSVVTIAETTEMLLEDFTSTTTNTSTQNISSNPFEDVKQEEISGSQVNEYDKMQINVEKSTIQEVQFPDNNSVADNNQATIDLVEDTTTLPSSYSGPDLVEEFTTKSTSDLISETTTEQVFTTTSCSVDQTLTDFEFVTIKPSPEEEETSQALTKEISNLTLQEEETLVVNSASVTSSEMIVNELHVTSTISELVEDGEQATKKATSESTTATSVEVESIAATAAVVTATVAGAAAVTTAVASESLKPVKKEAPKDNSVKGSTIANSKATTTSNTTFKKPLASKLTSSRTTTTTASAKSSTSTLPRKPLTSTTTSRTATTAKSSANPSTVSKTATRSPTSTSTLKSSTSTSRVGAASTLTKKPTQTSTTAPARSTSLTSRTATSTTSRPPARTTTSNTTSSLAAKRPATTTRAPSSTLNRSSTTSTSRTATASRTAVSSTASTTARATASKDSEKKETSTSTAKPAPKRASTGSMLSRTPASKTSSSVLNRSVTSTSTSRPGTISNLKPSTRSSLTSTTSSTRSPGSSSTRTAKTTTGATSSTTKSTTSSLKVAVPRLGARKSTTDNKTSSTPTTGETKEEVTNHTDQKANSSPFEATALNSTGTLNNTITSPSSNGIKRDKSMPNSANSLKDELEAALASPISNEDKGVIKGTKDENSSENL